MKRSIQPPFASLVAALPAGMTKVAKPKYLRRYARFNVVVGILFVLVGLAEIPFGHETRFFWPFHVAFGVLNAITGIALSKKLRNAVR